MMMLQCQQLKVTNFRWKPTILRAFLKTAYVFHSKNTLESRNVQDLPPLQGTITYPTLGKGKSSTQKCQAGGDMLVPRMAYASVILTGCVIEILGVTAPKMNMEPNKLVVWVDVSPFPKGYPP